MTSAVGADLSRYNVSFNPLIATGRIDFVFQKATEGLTYVDLKYEDIWQGVKQIPIRGAYHYQRSGLSWLAQADHFLETVERHDYHIYALDLEQYNNTYSDTFFADTRRIITHWQSNSNKVVVLYTNQSTYDELCIALNKLYGITNGSAWADTIPLWISYPNNKPGVPLMPVFRKSGGWQIHQYSYKGMPSRWGTGGTAVDENVFNGDFELMKGWAGIAPEGEPMYQGEAGPDGAKIWRSIGGVQIANVKAGDPVTGAAPLASGYTYLNTPTAGYTKTSMLADYEQIPIVTPPPVEPPPVTGPTLTHTITVYSDGSVKVDGVPAN